VPGEKRPAQRPALAQPPRVRSAPPTPNDESVGQLARGTDQIAARGTAPHLDQVDEQDQVARLRELEAKLAACMATLQIHMQPIVHAATRARFGYEALMRSTDKSLPHPGAVLDAAERLEKVTQLGRALRGLTAKIVTDAPAERGLFFVNLHLLDLLDKQLTSAFAPLTKVASRVVLEITERTSLQGHADIRYRVAELKELGFKIAIDDLGGGHARMGTFSPFDTDFVKLDMSLVRDLDKHPTKQRLVKSIIELCAESNTKVVGEGVETEAEAKVLVDLGCDLLQGYLIARPQLPFIDPL
jgi:EAL domain-containing protein (putative c-di-GMP-specific phosphodiesterase class I)